MAGDVTVDSKSNVSNSFPEQEIPSVFQCERCRHIIGDSTAWVCADETLRTFVLHSVTNAVVAEEKIEISSDEYDIGCTYLKLLCRYCKTPIGRMYKTTARHLDHLRDLFTFHVDSINSYQFGNMDCTVDQTDLVNMPTLKGVKSTLSKIQRVMVCFNSRLTAVEKKTMSEDIEIQDIKDDEFDGVSTCSSSDGNVKKAADDDCKEKVDCRRKNGKLLTTNSGPPVGK